nr:HAD family phosphatase [Candidatus Babeliales bacterium]
MRYKAIIFDMDGTIIATESVWEQSSKALLKKHGNLSDQECHALLPHMKGASLYKTCELIKQLFQLDIPLEHLIAERESLAFRDFGNGISLIDGFENFHQQLATHNLKSAIATNATESSLQQILKTISLDRFFKHHIYTIDRVNKQAKPKPDVYLFAAEQLGVQPDECITIEDSAHGIAAAKAAKMFCIGINTG